MDSIEAVLIVDDKPDVHQAIRLALAPYVRRIEGVSSPDGLPAMLASSPFDCVLLDMNFAVGERSGREGISALELIKPIDPTLAVVFMTAHGAVSLAVEGLKRGAHDFLLKPWRNDALVAAVRGAADRTRSAREGTKLDSLERSAIVRALDRNGGNIAQTAASLGLSRPALYRRLAKHGL